MISLKKKAAAVSLAASSFAGIGAAAMASAAPADAASYYTVSMSQWAPRTCGGYAAGVYKNAVQTSYYNADDASYATAASTRHTYIGMQAMLCRYGYSLVLDGYKGAATTNALKDFQRKHGLVADGIYGPATARVLVHSFINPFHGVAVSNLMFPR